ncbi:MAG: DUF6456 domain-containing protein [Paracoccaceae bacterium]
MSNKHQTSRGKLSQIWLDKAAFHYDAHVHLGLSIRELARQSASHASTILRQIRRIEALQGDPQVKAALAKLKSSRGEGAEPASSCPPDQSFNEDVINHLKPKNAVLVMSENVEMAGIFLISSESEPQKLGLVPRAHAQSMIASGALHCVSAGRLSRYVLASNLQPQNECAEAPQAFQTRPNPAIETEPVFKGSPETPLMTLARRRNKDGSYFLTRALVAAGNRFHDDFEIAQTVRPDGFSHEDWLRCASGAALSGGSEKQQLLIERVAATLRDLGPELSDISLRCCCYLDGLELSEQSLGWSARSGKVVLRIALQRLKRYYESHIGVENGRIG